MNKQGDLRGIAKDYRGSDSQRDAKEMSEKYRTHKEKTEEWDKQHPEEALNLKPKFYDFSDKYPKVKCPACGEKLTWSKNGRYAFCFGCHTSVSFSAEGLESIYKKQGK